MLDVIKAAFELANNGWLGVVLLVLSLTTVVVLGILLRRQSVLLKKTHYILDKTNGFDTLNSGFKSFSEEIDRSFFKVHGVIDKASTRHQGANQIWHEQVSREHNQLSTTAHLIGKDLAEIKGMFNSVMAGMRTGVK